MEKGKTLQAHLDSRNLVTFVSTNDKGGEEQLALSPHLAYYNSNDVYPGRWNTAKNFADAIHE